MLRGTLMGNLPSQNDVLEIYGKIMVNAFNIDDLNILQVILFCFAMKKDERQAPI